MFIVVTHALLAGRVPAGLEAPCAYLEEVLRVHADHGGPILRSLELQYAACRLARAWLLAGLSERALPPWLVLAATTAFGSGRQAAAVAWKLSEWAIE